MSTANQLRKYFVPHIHNLMSIDLNFAVMVPNHPY